MQGNFRAGGLVSSVDVRYQFGPVHARTSLDGSLYEAVTVKLDIDNQPFAQLHYGYRMGLAAGESKLQVSDAAPLERYDLISLPEPVVEGRVTEHLYVPALANTPWGHYFYASSDAERAVLDASPDWRRTGLEFKSGGYLPVCRFFYRPPSGGQPTHFYTAKPEECAQFKTLPGFTYEGTPFRASLPRPPQPGQALDDPARCPLKTVPLWRLFNQPGNSAVAPNHRYVLHRVYVDYLATWAAPRWAAEGIAFCVPE